jgi:NADH dehydrogenase [ubiquinone] 1 alpha subcomplex assembly factor 5
MFVFAISRRQLSSVTRPLLRRSLASVASSGSSNPLTVGPFRVFDREAKVIQKNTSATAEGGSRSRTVDYVREEVADRLLERLMVRSPHTTVYSLMKVAHILGYQAQV